MVDVISNLHYYNMILVLASGTVAGVWGLILFFMKKPINRSWRISLIVAAVVAALQAPAASNIPGDIGIAARRLPPCNNYGRDSLQLLQQGCLFP